jgi:hypothetical protein
MFFAGFQVAICFVRYSHNRAAGDIKGLPDSLPVTLCMEDLFQMSPKK